MFKFILTLTNNTTDDFGECLIASDSGSLFHYQGIAETLMIDNDYFNCDSDTYDYIRCLNEIEYDKKIVVIVKSINKHQLLCDNLSELGIDFIEGYQNIDELPFVPLEQLKIKIKPYLVTRSSNILSKCFKLIENKKIKKIRELQKKKNLKYFNKRRNIIIKEKKKFKKIKGISVIKQVEDNW